MQSMELDDEDKLDAPVAGLAGKPDFPWGLRISLTEKEFVKLNLDPSEAVVGGIVHLHALARITSVSHSDSEHNTSGPSTRVEMQIEDMCIESEDSENDDDN